MDSRYRHRYPIFTEKFYSENHRGIFSEKEVLLSFPWAGYLDVLNSGEGSDPEKWMQSFDPDLMSSIKKEVRSYKRIHVICQHINWRLLLPLWKELGVTNAAICHLEVGSTDDDIKLRSWPLFACNYELGERSSNLKIKDVRDKKYLASFIGSYQRNHRTKIRLDLQALSHERLFYELRDNWFLNGEVYSEPSERTTHQYNFNITKYNSILSDSVFSLCPEGAGPNTIRLWESMAVGSIPVIYSDEWVPPQFPGIDWGDFAIFIPSRDYARTFEILSAIDEDKTRSMSLGCINSYRRFLKMSCFGDPLCDFLNSEDHEESLDNYKKFCCSLMYQDPKIIRMVTCKLREGIGRYSRSKSRIYENHGESKVYDRKNIIKEDWLVKEFPEDRLVSHSTSGSTTGEPFSFYWDKKHWEFIQRNCEFDLIKEEYNLCNKKLQILNLLRYSRNPKVDGFTLRLENHQPGNKFNSFGAEKFVTYFLNFDNYMMDPEGWHGQFLDFLSLPSTPVFDIVLSSGPIINILTRHIKRRAFTKHFAYLLSHTTEFPRIDDFQFLQKNGNITYYCDHMRCWDGGASFFTCKFGTHHLLDNFSWVCQGENNSMISTDYFNIAAPFVNYCNGDKCEISDEYLQCKCGRWYRPFKMLQNRPFALKGPTRLTQIKDQIAQLEFKSKIDQIQFEGLEVNVYLNDVLDEESMEKIKSILSDYTIKFYQ